MRQLFVLSLGGAEIDKRTVLLAEAEPGQRIWTPSYAFVIRDGEGRVILVDTGMHPAHIEDPDHTFRGSPFAESLTPRMSDGDRLEAQLARLDLTPADVTHVINTHLHFDHAGSNALFTGRPIFVQREHYEHARGNPVFPARYWDLPELRYELLDGEAELLPGIEAVVTPGHAVGHQSLLVRVAGEAPVLLCGDAILSEENLRLGSWATQADPRAARASAQRLETLARERGAWMVFGHDPVQASELRYAPEGYGT